MEEKTDKVVGYIEYLGAGGIIGEIVPYTGVEKFKDEILDSLDCGRPVTPVVFSDELDEPLQFDSGTYFPWGFRSEKRVQIPYEIYQTNRRDLVFMEYSPARLAAGAKDYELVYKGQMERWETLDSIYSRHNRDDRPNAKTMRSVSVSDIIVTHKDNETHAFYVQPIGYKQVDNLLPELENATPSKSRTARAIRSSLWLNTKISVRLPKSNCKPSRRAVTVGKHFCGQRPLLIIIVSRTSFLIHEQSPTATAVADIAYWNNNAGRWVKRGAHGIAVFDTRANSSRLRYLFDISDTIPRAEIPEALPWVITDQNWRPVWDKIVADNHADSIQSALLMLSTSCVAQRSAMFTTALGKAIDGSSLQWAKPDEQRQLFLQLITQSCLYMAALRCGVDTARLDLSALESVNQFDTNRITLCLGSACQQAARPLMQQIGSITREIDSVARAEKSPLLW